MKTYLEDVQKEDGIYEKYQVTTKTQTVIIFERKQTPQTKEEIAEQEKQSRITELESLIDKGNKVGDDVSVYQIELKALYDGTHDTYIESIKQEALDNQILELMEGGLL